MINQQQSEVSTLNTKFRSSLIWVASIYPCSSCAFQSITSPRQARYEDDRSSEPSSYGCVYCASPD